MSGFTIRWLPGTEAWRPHPHLMRRIEDHYGPKLAGTRVTVWPRSWEVIDDLFPGRNMGYYDVRAVSRDDEVHILVDETETPTSIAWLLAHELGHQRVRLTPGLRDALRDAAPVDVTDKASDEYHEVDPEERFVDGVATKLTMVRKDREWWRERTRRHPHHRMTIVMPRHTR